jgi:hypothetical protein
MVDSLDPELSAQLRAYCQVLDAVPDRPLHRVPNEAPVRMGHGAVSRRRVRPLTVWAGVAGLIVLVAVVAVVVFSGLTQPDRPRDRESFLADIPLGETRPLATAPISGRVSGASAWTGTELVIWGGAQPGGAEGYVPLSDGAIYNPRSNTWRDLAAAPISARFNANTVWTGSEMIVWGGTGTSGLLGDGAAYNPTTNTWRMIAKSPLGPRSSSDTLWTGSEMLVVSGATKPTGAIRSHGAVNTSVEAAAYDPANDRWRELPDAPGTSTLPYPRAVWTGTQAFFLLDGSRGRSAGAPQVFAGYDPGTNQWVDQPQSDLVPNADHIAWPVWTGNKVLILGSGPGPSAAYDPISRAWTPLTAAPGVLGDYPVWSGQEALFWSGREEGLAYNPASNTWRGYDAGNLSRRGDGVARAWTGEAMLAWGGYTQGSGANDGIAYRPASIQSGSTELTLGAGTPFVPPTRKDGDQTVMSLTLLNGDTIDLQYPTSLGLEKLKFTPATGIDWHPDGAPADCCSRQPEIRHGTIEQVFAGRAPTKTYAGRDGRVVEYFTGTTTNYLAFQIGRWVVAVPDYDPGSRFAASNPPMTDQQRATYAAKVSGHETTDGSLVLDALEPLTLARAKFDVDLGDGKVIIMYRNCDTNEQVPAGTHGFTVDADSPSTGTWLCYARIPIVVHITGSRSFQQQLTEGLQIPANHQSAYG